jgi:heat-inducible transcriptional repressor
MTISRTVESYGLPAAKELENMLNEGLSGKSLFDIIYASKTQKLKTDDIRLTNMFNLIEVLLNEFSRNKYLIKGLEKIINKFKPNIESVESLTKIIENDYIKDKIFENIDYSHELNVFFGSDLKNKSLKNFAFFSTSYSLGSNPIGRMLFITDKFCNYEMIYKIIREYNSRFSEIISKNL